MIKKLSICLLTAITVGCFAFGLSACGNSDKAADEWGSVYTVSAAYAKATELGYTGTLEEFIAEISGTDGKDGTNGKDGKDGKDGTNGKDGKDGKDGKGIDSVNFNADGELVITFTDGTVKSLGNVPEHNHSFGDWKVVIEPDCTSIGYSVRNCEKCGVADYKFTEKTGHNWDDGVIIKKPTSIEKGLKIYSCTVCRTAKTEEIDCVETLSEAEWRQAVNNTIMSDNFSYECESEQVAVFDGRVEKQKAEERVIINLDKNVSYYFLDEDYNGRRTVCERYYRIDEKDKVYFERIESPDTSYRGWKGVATISEYTFFEEPELVKYELNNGGYSFLEGLKNLLTYEEWNGKLLIDAYDLFEYDTEKEAYCFKTDNNEIYSLKFDDGFLTELNLVYVDGQNRGEYSAEFTYGNAKVSIPESIQVKELEFDCRYMLDQDVFEIKSTYFGMPVTSISACCFDGDNIGTVIIPASVKKIGEHAFYNSNIQYINYGGTKAQWNSIQKGESWTDGGLTVRCTDGDIKIEKIHSDDGKR